MGVSEPSLHRESTDSLIHSRREPGCSYLYPHWSGFHSVPQTGLLSDLLPSQATILSHRDDNEAAENIWRYDTSMELSMSKWKAPYTDTPYQDAAAKYVSFINLLSLSKASV